MPERSRVRGYLRRCPLELMGEDRATRRYGALHRLDEALAAVTAKRGKGAAFHEHALPIGQIRIEQLQ